jgi:hypothetical protein
LNAALTCGCQPDAHDRLPYENMCPEHRKYNQDLHDRAQREHMIMSRARLLDPDNVGTPFADII